MRLRSLLATATLLTLATALAPLAGPAGAVGTFDDDDGNIHEENIEKIAALGITKGCNPPDNNLYCPDDLVTRQQMASFLVRTFDLPPGPSGQFTDTSGSVHEADIDALAASGITRGCNPPDNDEYCPTDLVTRGQMAAFMARGLNLENVTEDFFTDDDGDIFELQINAIARVGITRGCNPPENTEYCPDNPVRRDEMASFLSRVADIVTTGTTSTTTPAGASTTTTTTTTPGQTTTSSTIAPPTTTTTLPPPGNVGPWESVADGDGPTARHENGFIQVGGKMFLIGGRGTRPVEEFDPARDVWVERGTSTTDVHHFQPAVYDGKIYLLGAMTGAYPVETPLAQVSYYDPDTDDIVDTHTIPADRRRGSAGVVVHGGYLYIAGGVTLGHGQGDDTNVLWFDRYDPRNGLWAEMPDIPRRRDHFQAVVVDDKMYLIGGRRGGVGPPPEFFDEVVAEVDVFDFDTGQWSTLPSGQNLPTPRAASMNVAIDGAIYVIGGEGNGQAYGRVDRFNTNSGDWEPMPALSPARHGTGAALCSRNIYVASGSTVQGENETNAFHVLDPDGDGSQCELAWSPSADNPTIAGADGAGGRSEAMAAAVDGSLYVTGGYIAWSPRATTAANHRYLPASDLWQTSPAAMPAPIHGTHVGTATNGDHIYMAGGYQHLCSVPSLYPDAVCPGTRELATVEVRSFDPANNTWSTLPDLPAERGSGGLVLAGDTLHFFGGTDSGTTNANREEQGDHWRLDLGNTSAGWVDIGDPLPAPRSHFGYAAIGTDIYAVGGQTGAEAGAVAVNTVHRYRDGAWTQLTGLPDTLSHHSSTTFVLAGHIITVGGERGHHEEVATVYDYNPFTGDWVALTPLPVATQAAAGALIDGDLYIAGGGGATTGDFKVDTWTGSYD